METKRKPFPHIGNIELQGFCVLAPMAGVSDVVCRVLSRQMGAAMVTTEMVSSRGLHYQNEKTAELLRLVPKERPVAVQLFGNDPAVMAEAAQVAEAAGADAIDINMGCPMHKVVKNGDGSALMKDLPRAAAVIERTALAVRVPVTVKMRLGWSRETMNATELARMAEAAGAAALTVHGRTREELYSGAADWGEIARVVASVSIPVFGNGDVTDGPSAAKMMEETGCAGVAVGRAAWGNPWVFREINAYLETGEILPKPSREERLSMAAAHLHALVLDKGEYIAVREMRAHASRYLHGLPHATSLRRDIMKAETEEAFVAVLFGEEGHPVSV